MTAHCAKPDCKWCEINRGLRWQHAFYGHLHGAYTKPPDRDASDMHWDVWAAENGLEFVEGPPLGGSE